MNVLIISPLFEGSTSLMRLEAMKQLLPVDTVYDEIDTQEIIDSSTRVYRILAYRYKVGPVVRRINRAIGKYPTKEHYDLIWIDKGVFINVSSVRTLKAMTTHLVHYTPDPAFTFHKSKRFYKALKYYDYVVTTKSFELEHYYKYKSEESVILVSQAFSAELHRSLVQFEKRKEEVVFIGHHEDAREEVLAYLINNNIPVTLSGRGWSKFVKKNKPNIRLTFIGEKTYGYAYAKALNEHKFSIGFLSDWIPELHTTRTFEIPACGCLLFTPDNQETRSFFSEKDVVFYNSKHDIHEGLIDLMKNPNKAKKIATSGHTTTMEGPYSHIAVVKLILNRIALP